MNCWSFDVLAARGRSSGAIRRLDVLLNTRERTVITRTPRIIPQPTTIQLAAWRRRSFTVFFSIYDQRRSVTVVKLTSRDWRSASRQGRLRQLSQPSEQAGVLTNDLCASQGSDDRCDPQKRAKRKFILAVLARKFDVGESDNRSHKRAQHDG